MNPEEVMDDLALTNDDLALTNDDLPLDNDDLPLNNDDLPLSDDDLPLSDDDLRVSDDEEFVGYIVDSSDDDELAGEYNGLRTHQSDQTLPCVIPRTSMLFTTCFQTTNMPQKQQSHFAVPTTAPSYEHTHPTSRFITSARMTFWPSSMVSTSATSHILSSRVWAWLGLPWASQRLP